MSALDKLSRWVNLKLYQLEVTLSVYIFTPVEKFVFYSILFLLVSLTFIGTVLYLPQHIAFLMSRAWFYMHGESVDVMGMAQEALGPTTAAAADAAATFVKEL